MSAPPAGPGLGACSTRRRRLREIEAAVDEHLAAVRARMLQDAALASAAADLRALPAAERPACPDCGRRLEARGGRRAG